MVTGVGDEQAHVREQRCRLEQLAFVMAETVTPLEPVEERQRKLRHLERVVGILVAHLHQVLDAAATQVREVVERRTVQPIVEVEQHTLAKRVLTDDERLDVERVHHLLEDDRAPDDDVRPPLVDPLDLGSGLRGLRREQPLDHLAERRPRQDGTVDRLLDRTLGCPSDAEETLDGPRAADRHLERVRRGLANERSECRPDEPAGPLDRTLRRHAALEEPLGHANCTELETAADLHFSAVPDQQLGAAAADVAQDQRRVVERQRLQDPEVDETGLLMAGDDLDVDARLVVRPPDEVVAVLGFANRRRRHRLDGGAVGVDHAPATRQRGDAPVDRPRGEVLEVIVARLTQPHHLLVAGDDLESAVGRHARHHHVHRVRPDVDRRQHVGHGAPRIGTRPLHLGPGGSVDGRMYPISHLPSV